MKRIELSSHEHTVEDLNIRYSEAVRSKTALFFFEDDVIAFKNSTQYTGLNKHSKKQWYRWKLDNSISVRRNARGLLVPTQRLNNGRWYGGRIAMQQWMDRAYGVIVRNARESLLSAKEAEILASILKEVRNLPLNDMWGPTDRIPAGGFLLAQEKTPADLTNTLFGVTRYRKDLVKAVAGSHLATVMLASAFRGLVPTDWIIKFLNDSTLDKDNLYFSPRNYALVRPMLKQLDKRAYRHLLNDPLAREKVIGLDDLLRDPRFPYEQMENARPKTWEDMHDIIYPARRRRLIPAGVIRHYTPPAPVEIKPSLAAQRIHDAFEGTKYTHIMPTGSAMLNDWSDEMGNCIRSYGRVAANQSVILGAIELDGKMICNYEVMDDMTVRQLLGRRNHPLDRATHDEIASIMTYAGVIFPTYYQGKPHVPGAGIRIAY